MATLEPPVDQRAVDQQLASRGIHGIPRRRALIDRWNRFAIAAGGQGVIALILAICVFLVVEAWPLAVGGKFGATRTIPTPHSQAHALLVDDYRTHVAALGLDGVVRASRMDGSVVLERSVLPKDMANAKLTRVFPVHDASEFLATTQDGRLLLIPMRWDLSFVENQRNVTPRIADILVAQLGTNTGPAIAATARSDGDQTTLVAQFFSGEVLWQRSQVEVNDFTGERTETVQSGRLDVGRSIEHMLLDRNQRRLYAAGAAGELLWWDLSTSAAAPNQIIQESAQPITALTLLKGGRSLVVGREDGSLTLWFRIRRSEFSEQLTLVRSFEAMSAAVEALAPAHRDRSFLATDASGGVALYFGSSGETLWQGQTPISALSTTAIAPKGDAALFATSDRIVEWELDAPHPEASWRSYFSRVWYEEFQEPGHVWQSTGGTDEFESKLGLIPLIFGTLKGTLYSLILALPLAILGAMYTSQFMHPRFQRIVKPGVELMASLPSVVLGLVAGLWLAPNLEAYFPAMLLMLLVAPFALVAAGWLWSLAPGALRTRVPSGGEVAWFAIALVLAAWAAASLGPALEQHAFAGDFQEWLFSTMGLRYDQRNAAVVGIAMGFAVIPIIFSIAEDAFSSVPRELAAGSLALGANRWETVVRVILPTASPAIFSAAMVGLGRAVGETMIVLMATGNTPITDWSLFNGFRTLSANIAVEIPEAPHGGTLYRTLFLTALLLFAFTFIINTLAEVVRIRLRERYGRI